MKTYPSNLAYFANIRILKRLSLAALVVLALVGCNHSTPENTASKPVTPSLRSMVVQAEKFNRVQHYDGTVEAVRQTDLAAQVSAMIVQLNATAGDHVKKDQVLVRLDAQASHQAAAASGAQLAATQAQLNLARQEYARQEQLYAKNYISKAALDQAAATLKSAQAQVNAQSAQTGVANVQTGFHSIKAPYDGIVSAVPATVGDMAMPGKPLLTLYDPSRLRVQVSLPQSVADSVVNSVAPQNNNAVSVVIGNQSFVPTALQWLPSANADTHSRILRIDLPANTANITPGMNANIQLTTSSGDSTGNVWVPQSALVKHGELTAVYVIAANGQPLLRQLRLGATQGEQIEVLSGLSAGEKIAQDPQIAAGAQ